MTLRPFFGPDSASRPSLIFQEFVGDAHSLGKADPLHPDPGREGGCQPCRKAAVQHHEDAAVGGAPDQPAEGLAQLQPRHPVNPGIASLPFGARLEQHVGPWPRHAVEDDQPQRLARHVDAIAHGPREVGAADIPLPLV